MYIQFRFRTSHAVAEKSKLRKRVSYTQIKIFCSKV